MFKRKLRQLAPPILFFAMLLTCIALSAWFLLRAADAYSSAGVSSRTLVIDPGHGGIDGGAIAENGTKESDINLSISLCMRDLAELIGMPVVMTRTDDSCRTDFSDYSEHEDLVFRTGIINSVQNAILISVHQNDFPTGQPSGSQVLYATGEESKSLGLLTHSNLIAALDPSNRRVAEPAPRSLYITAHVDCPAILVECGFMSNNFEVEKLCRSEYRCRIALVLVSSFLQYMNINKTI